MIGKIWIQANMNENGIVDLLVTQGVADKIKGIEIYEIGSPAVKCEFERDREDDHGEHSGGYVYNRLFETLRQTPEAFPAGLPGWIRTVERKPTAEDANEDGCVLSINMNRGDRNTTAWPWNVVAAFPDCLPVWMPLPKKPDLKEEHFHR